MRKSFPVTIPAGGSWPGVTDGAPGADSIRAYRYIRFHNRGLADVIVGLDGKVQNSAVDYWEYVPAGARITRNVGGEHDEPAHGLNLTNIDPVNTAVLRVEISDSPIIDIDHAQLGGTSAAPTVVQGAQTPGDGIATPVDAQDSRAWIELFGATTSSLARQGSLTGSQLIGTMPATATEGTAAATAAAAAVCTATIAAVAAKFGYLEGFDVTLGQATAAALSAVAVTGLASGTLTYEVQQTTGAGATLVIRYARPLRSSAVNTAITVTCPATTSGGVPAVVAYGWTN